MTADISWPADNAPSDRWTIYTRGNVGEVFPGVVLPLEWDLGGLPSERGWRLGAQAVGFLTPADYGDREFEVIGVFGGYAYFNASLMRLLGVRTPGLAVDVIDSQFLGEADVPAYQPAPGDRNLRATIKVIRTALRTMRAKEVPLVDEMRATADKYRAGIPPMDAPTEVLWQYILDGLDRLWDYFIASHVTNTMQATIASGGLTDLCEKHLGDPNLALQLTAGIGDVVSAEPARHMWRLANETPADQFDEAFAAFLDRFGHRGPNEFSLAGRDWAAFPDVAMAAIDNMRDVDPDRSPDVQERRIADQQAAVLADARARLGRRAKRLDSAIAATALWSRAREESKDQVIRAAQPARHTYLELIRRARENGGVEDRIGPLLLSQDEFVAYLADPPSMAATIEQRRTDYHHLEGLEPPFAFDVATGGVPPTSTWSARRTEATAATTGDTLDGAAGAPGTARGRARVITDPSDPAGLEPGDILVAPLTDPAWTPLFVPAGGVVVEIGAAMSHSMIVSRELGIPCVVGVVDATLRIPDGAEIEVDGSNGTVRLV